MDAVCLKGSWDAVIAKDTDGNPEGVLVFHQRNYKGFKLILMPPITFYNGIHFFYKENQKDHSQITFENRVTEKLLSLLPKHDLYYQQYNPSIKNCLVQLWQKYNLSTRYTYRINADAPKEKLWDGLKGNVRRNIKKSREICVIKASDFERFWKNLEQSFRGRHNPFQKKLLASLTSSLKEIDGCKISVCEHKETGKVMAGSIIAYDKDVSYYVCGFFNPDGKEIGALSHLLWHNITTCNTKTFDFEGSMIKEIEYFFRAFGGQLTPHYKVWKIHSPILRFIFKFKRLPFIQ